MKGEWIRSVVRGLTAEVVEVSNCPSRRQFNQNVTCWNSQWERSRGMCSAPPSPKIPIWDATTNLGSHGSYFHCSPVFAPLSPCPVNFDLLPKSPTAHCPLSVCLIHIIVSSVLGLEAIIQPIKIGFCRHSSADSIVPINDHQ